MKMINIHRWQKKLYVGLNTGACMILASVTLLTILRIVFPTFTLLKYLRNVYSHSVELCVVYIIFSMVAYMCRNVDQKRISTLYDRIMYVLVSAFLVPVILKYYVLDPHVGVTIFLYLGMYLILSLIIPMQAQFAHEALVSHTAHFQVEDYTFSMHYIFNTILRASALIGIILICTSPLMYVHKKNIDFQEYQRKQFVVTSIVPPTGVIAEEVVMTGYNFRWRDNESYIINSTYGPIVSNVWEDTKVSFIVPLHLKNGPMDIWLERSIEENSTKGVIKSNRVRFTLAPRETYFSVTDDSFFDRVIKKVKRLIFLL